MHKPTFFCSRRHRQIVRHLAFRLAIFSALSLAACSGTTGNTTVSSTSGSPIGTQPAPAPGPVYSDGTARLNALFASSLNVSIPAGTYTINGPLNVRNGQVIQPAAGAQVIFKAAPGYTGSFITTYSIQYTMRGITLDGNYANRLSEEGKQAAALVVISGGSNITLENNTFQYAPSYAVWEYKAPQLQVRGNTFLECWQPIRIDGANLAAGSGTIENNTFTNTAAYKSVQHLDAINTVNLVVRGNTMSGAGTAEPTTHGYEGTWGNSIYIFNSTGYLVELNKVWGNYWSSLVSGTNGTYATIRNNNLGEGLRSTAAVWIEQPGAHDVTLDNNQLDGGLSIGDSGGDYLKITNNTIRSRSVGIDVNSAAKHITIQGNTITSKASTRTNNGIYLWEKTDPDTNIQVQNNAISGFNNGIAVNNYGGTGTVYGIYLSGNTFSNNNTNVWVPSAIIHQPFGQ